eukprot:s668_g17.t1
MSYVHFKNSVAEKGHLAASERWRTNAMQDLLAADDLALQSEILVDHPDVHMARDRAALPHAVASKGRQAHPGTNPEENRAC